MEVAQCWAGVNGGHPRCIATAVGGTHGATPVTSHRDRRRCTACHSGWRGASGGASRHAASDSRPGFARRCAKSLEAWQAGKPQAASSKSPSTRHHSIAIAPHSRVILAEGPAPRTSSPGRFAPQTGWGPSVAAGVSLSTPPSGAGRFRNHKIRRDKPAVVAYPPVP